MRWLSRAAEPREREDRVCVRVAHVHIVERGEPWLLLCEGSQTVWCFFAGLSKRRRAPWRVGGSVAKPRVHLGQSRRSSLGIRVERRLLREARWQTPRLLQDCAPRCSVATRGNRLCQRWHRAPRRRKQRLLRRSSSCRPWRRRSRSPHSGWSGKRRGLPAAKSGTSAVRWRVRTRPPDVGSMRCSAWSAGLWTIRLPRSRRRWRPRRSTRPRT